MSEVNRERVRSEESDGTAMHRANAQQSRVTRLERFRCNGDSSVIGSVHKMCCVCGKELNHRPRFKDAEGRYWCPQCNEADQLRKQMVPCADCMIEMPRNEMVQICGSLLCRVCAERRHTRDEEVQMRAVSGRQGNAGGDRYRRFWIAVMVATILAMITGVSLLLHTAF